MIRGVVGRRVVARWRVVLAAVMVLAVGVVVPGPPVTADEAPPVFLTSWGWQGSAEGEFLYPWGIGIDSVGDLYIADRDNHRIQKFTADGAFIAEWGTYGADPGQFKNPYGVVVDDHDTVFVVDTTNDRVQSFTTDGTFIHQWGTRGSDPGQFRDPQGVDLDPDGNLVVAEGGNNRIQRFSPDGTYLGQWGDAGTGPGQFNYPRDVAVGPTGTVYVADTNNHRIQRFSADGTFLSQWGGQGAAPGQFANPFSVRVDGAGTVYVADYGNDRMQRFTANGAYMSQWGSEGSGNGEFRAPQSVSVDQAGNIYVSDSENYRVQKFVPGVQGAVSGTVTTTGSGTPIGGVWLAALRPSDFSIVATTVAGENGAFSFPIAPGSYFLYLIDPTGHHPAGFHGPPTMLGVTAGQVTPVSPTMVPNRGSFTGTVRTTGTETPIPGAWALALSAADGSLESLEVASGTGAYRLSGLAPGSHFLGWVDPTGQHATRFSPNSPTVPGASTVAVGAGATTTVDGSLPASAATGVGAPITGTVVEAGTSTPLAGVHVLALRASDFALARGAITNGSGVYSLDLAPGPYLLAFVDPDAAHTAEWFDDRAPTGLAEATPVTAPGVADAALAPTRGSLTGTVTDAGTGAPIAGTWVLALGPTGLSGGAVTGADGTYRIDGLVPGTYRVTFADPVGGRRQEFWDDASDYGGATAFPVAAGVTVTRDATLARS